MSVPNVLAERYASRQMRDLWSPESRVIIERELWVAVLEAQRQAGLGVSDEAISAYRANIANVDLPQIRQREMTTQHDVKARIEEFNSLAGFELIHLGLTSRDVTENVEQLLIRRSSVLIADRIVALLARWAEKAMTYSNVRMVARTHNVPAQLTTLGKRFATWAEELLFAYLRLQELIDAYPLRGITGAVGTAADIFAVLDRDENKARDFSQAIEEHLGGSYWLRSTGQIYPRSLDFQVVAALTACASAPSSFATTLRLLAGEQLANEGFAQGQVGSSAMPHKMNARSCERINGLNIVLKGLLNMVSDLSGNQWYEGDVSCSVVRRVALPDSFFATDALICAAIRVTDQMQIFEDAIEVDVDTQLPLLASGQIMAAATKGGVGREQAHQVIGEQARLLMEKQRSGEVTSFAQELARDGRLGLSESSIAQIIEAAGENLGSTQTQVAQVVEAVAAVMALRPGAVGYQPESSV